MKNVQKSIFLSIYLCATSFLSLAKTEPASAQQPSCQDTVNSVLQNIRNRGTTVRYEIRGDEYQQEDLNTTLGNTNRINGIDIALHTSQSRGKSGNVAYDILHSPALMKNYANQIFVRCGGTGRVSLGQDGTDWGIIFVMRDDGVLGVEKCDGYSGDLGNRISEIYTFGELNCAYFTPDF